jgi:HlyD family secretion protein
MAIYASSVRNRRRNNEEPIRTGTLVDERDDIIYLPTASEFIAAIKIPEVSLNKVQPGMPVRITIDALPGENVTGAVKSIAQLPDAESRYLNPNLKLYETIIAVNPSSAPIRNGMSCTAEVIVERYDDVVYVPLQSVVRVDNKTVVYKPGVAEPQEVDIGLDNARFVHVLDGLSPGERVLMTPPLAPVENTEQNARGKEQVASLAGVTP